MRRRSFTLAVLLLTIINSGVFAEPNLVEGLVGYWKFDEGAGSIAYDSSMNHNNGSIVGASWIPGLYGYAFNFDGTNDYINVPHSASLDDYPPISVSLWFKFFEYDSDKAIIVNKGDAWGIHLNESHRLVLGYNPGIYYESSETLNTDQWYHVIHTYDGTTARIVLDGVEVYNQNISQGSTYDSYALVFGGNSPDPYGGSIPYLFTGLLDEFRIYNRVLSEEEIQLLYNQPTQEGGPRLILQEPKAPYGVFTNKEGVGYLTLCWNESLSFVDGDVEILDHNNQSIPFSLSGSGSQYMYIVLDAPLLNDAYTITVKDTASGYETGKAIDGDGDGFAGGDAVIVLEHRQRLDSDDDNDIDLMDLSNLAQKWLWTDH